MLLTIQHQTAYRYARPVLLQPHRLLLTPRSNHELSFSRSALKTEPQADLDWSGDVFGNIVATANFSAPSERLLIESELTIDLKASDFPIFPIDPSAHEYPFAYSADDCAGLGSMTEYAPVDQPEILQNWAESFIRGSKTDTLSLLKDINAGILAHATYRTRDEAGTQSPLETLQLRSGSCRDLSALFIDAVRRLGFGARAVSGYLFDPDKDRDEEGSTHAWAQVYLPGAGWISFDATHQRTGDAYLIPLAVGRCNEQIMPVTGSYAGRAEDFLDMQVRVCVEPSKSI